eukprot:608725-Rhodomonas_salina.2
MSGQYYYYWNTSTGYCLHLGNGNCYNFSTARAEASVQNRHSTLAYAITRSREFNSPPGAHRRNTMSRVNTILGMILSFVFIMAGSQKITDVIHPDTHAFLANGAKSWGPVRPRSSALPFLSAPALQFRSWHWRIETAMDGKIHFALCLTVFGCAG